MTRDRISRVLKQVQWGSVVMPLLTVTGIVVTYWGFYETSARFRASVWRWVDLVGEGLAVGAAVVLLAVVAFVVWRFWRQVIRPFKWLYLWLLWRLVVRPATDHFAVMTGRVWRDEISRLSNPALQVLRRVLGPSAGFRLLRQIRFVPSLLAESLGLNPTYLSGACEELVRDGWLTKADFSEDGELLTIEISWYR